ncbi:MAG: TcpQ domain-containing protein [Bdellovibrionales bacterium]
MQGKPLMSLARSCGAVSFVVLMAVGAPAEAAFQWVPTDGAAPAVIQGRVTAASPPPVVVQSSSPFSSYPLDPTVIEAAKGQAASNDDLVLGFADSVPLPVALQQIVPKDTRVSIASDVPRNKLVSWQGGDTWRRVLQDMLVNAGLEMQESAGVVHVAAIANSQTSLSFLKEPYPVPVEGTIPLSGGVEKAADVQMAAPRVDVSAGPISLTSSSESGLSSRVDSARRSQMEGVSEVNTIMPSMAPVALTSPVGGVVANEWVAQKGRMLREVLETWAEQANVDLSWQAEYDYPIQATLVSFGSFEKAVRQLLVGFQGAEPQPYGNLYRNEKIGQMVLVVRVRGNKSVF